MKTKTNNMFANLFGEKKIKTHRNVTSIKASIEQKKAEKQVKFDQYVTLGNCYNYGINPENKFTATVDHWTDAFKPVVDEKTAGMCNAYVTALIAGSLKSSSYFTYSDSDICYLAKNLREAEFGTPTAEIAIAKLVTFMNQRSYWITHPSHEEKKLDTKSKCHQFRNAYYENKPIKRYDGDENVLKEAAWMAVHGMLLGILSSETIFGLIPRGSKHLITPWNGYINKMDDIDNDVKAMFLISKDGRCDYLEDHKKTFCKEDGPADDIPEDDSTTVKGHEIKIDSEDKNNVTVTIITNEGDVTISDIEEDKETPEEIEMEKKIIEANKKLDEEYHQAMANDTKTDSDQPKVEEVKEATEPAEITLAQAMSGTDKKKEEDVTDGRTIKEIIDQEDVELVVDDGHVNIPANNKDWDAAIPRLSKFTNLVKGLGFKVLYAQHPAYTGMILAYILDRKNQLYNILQLDPCIVYGDTLRVVTVEHEDDLRKEVFVPISRKDIITRMIKGEMTEEDKKVITDKLPECLKVVDGQYNILNYLDLRGLKNGDKDGLPFNQWCELVNNADEAIKGCPVKDLRYRIVDYVNPSNFKLLCDQYVQCAFDSTITQEPNNIEYAKNGFFINVAKPMVKAA